jgi:hypothetical protein
MADKDEQPPPEPLAWDRVGQFFQDMALVSQGIAERNQGFWNQVSRNLRRSKYPADAVTTDAAKAMTTAMDNLEDVWTFLTRPPERERVATPLPTVVLMLEEHGGVWGVDDPVWIRVPYWERQALAPMADVYLDGGDAKTVENLRSRVRAKLVEKSYCVQVVADGKDLEPGVYAGLVAVGSRPLANLRIVVKAAGP